MEYIKGKRIMTLNAAAGTTYSVEYAPNIKLCIKNDTTGEAVFF